MKGDGVGVLPPLPVAYRGYLLKPLKHGRYQITWKGEVIEEATCLDHAKLMIDDYLEAP